MTQDLIRYDLLVQNALRGVVRKVLTDVVRDGLPGSHHFYISFRTNESGVRISERLREKYPEEMTIVLQHEFWDLTVNERGFEVGLSFSKIPERLYVPFEAVMAFFDPSVPFGLKFEVKEEVAQAGVTAATDKEAPPPEVAPAQAQPTAPQRQEPETKSRRERPREEKPKAEAVPAEPQADDKSTAEVVSLDAFRKKQ